MRDSPKLSSCDVLWVAAPAEWREACLAVPALRALKRLELELVVLCPARQVGFWQSSGFGTVTGYSDKASARELAASLKEAKVSLAFEAGVVGDAMARAAVPRRMGPAIKGLVKRLTEPLEVIEQPGPVHHRVRFYLDLVEKLGAQAMVAENFAPAATGVARFADRVLLVPDSDFGRHFEWPLERWEAVAKDLSERGKQLWIATTGPIGTALAKAVPEATGVALALPGLDELSSCELSVVADGSLPHLAAHVGTTCVVLFGPGEPEWTRPLGRQHGIARRKVECSPCHAPKCRMDLRCQHELEVAEVLRVLAEIQIR